MRKILTAATIALLAAGAANATVIGSLYSTGVDAAHVATTGHGADLHWTVDDSFAFTGGTNGSFPIGPWVPDTSTVRWVTPTANAADGLDARVYTFSTTFDLTGYRPGTAVITGFFAADDSATIYLNGVPLLSGGGYTATNAFGGSYHFVDGINTLTVEVLNSGGGPTGLYLSVGGTAAVPEPASWGLMIAGFAMTGIAARRRARSLAA